MKKKLAMLLAIATVAIMGVIPAFAAESVDIGSVMGTAFTGLKGDFMTALAVALPVGLVIFGAIFTVRKVKKAFNAVAQ